MRGLGAAERYAAETNRPRLRALLLDHARRLLAEAEAGSDVQLALVRHLAALAETDPAELERLAGFLEGRYVPDGLAVDTDLRWALVAALARADAIDEATIAAELARDDTDLGRRSAAHARASRPRPEAKAAAFELLLDPDLPLATSRQVWAGFGQLDQAAVLAPFTDRYFETLPRVWRERTLDWSIEWTAGMFPHWAASDALVERVDALLGDDALARPQRRVLLEQRDTLVRTLRARALDAA
jgi:aminopeptidase N